jgi:Colicin D
VHFLKTCCVRAFAGSATLQCGFWSRAGARRSQANAQALLWRCTREETRISERQLGRKIGKHAADFGLDPANPVHRAQLRRLIAEITTSPDRVVEGTFRGQGAVKFFLKGEDVVVTTPMEDFVTILKGGVHNPAVQRALQYEAG